MPTPVAQLRAFIDHGTEPDIARRRVVLQLTARIPDPRLQGDLVDEFNAIRDELAFDNTIGQPNDIRRARAHEVLNRILDAGRG